METDKLTNHPSGLEQHPGKHFSKHVSVPAGEGERVEQVVTIQRPVSEVYSFWSRLNNLSRFMKHVESVIVKDDLHSHWIVKTVGGKQLAWDAEIIEQRENEMISWRSAPGADVDNAGSVWFSPTAGGAGTLVRLSLKYSPPGGKAGALVAKLFDEDAASEIEEDLQRLKSLLETGELPAEDEVNWSSKALKATRNAATRVDACIRDNPWSFILSVATVGLIAGFLLGRTGGTSRSMLWGRSRPKMWGSSRPGVWFRR